jgi:hypothetical protein
MTEQQPVAVPHDVSSKPPVAYNTWPWRAVFAAMLILVAARGGYEIACNSEPYCNNDEPRHMMTAVFISDLLRLHPTHDPIGFAYTYYGHYPAIAPLHYPPMQHALTGSLFAVIGPSVVAARLLILAMLIGLLVATRALARSYLPEGPATLAAVFLAAAPMVEHFRAVFMLEVPCMFWMTLTILFLRRYVVCSRPRDIWLSALAATLAVLTKQHGAVLLMPLAVGAVAGFHRTHWRSIHTYIGPAIGMLIVAAYYAMSIRTIHGAWVDLTSMPEGVLADNLNQFIWGLGPVAIGLAVAGLLIALGRRQVAWLDGVALAWALAVIVLHLAIVRTSEARYLVYAAPPIAILAATGLQRFGLMRTAAMQAVAAAIVLALCVQAVLATPQREMRGYQAAALEANRLTDHGTVLFSGRWDGLFILYRRIDDPQMKGITYRASKIFGGGNILDDRGYTAFVDSPEAVRKRFAETGAEWIVSEDEPEIDSREHLWFWDWLHGADFEEVRTIPVEYPYGPGRNLHIFHYRGPHEDGQPIEIHMLTLRDGQIGFNPKRSLLNWNTGD